MPMDHSPATRYINPSQRLKRPPGGYLGNAVPCCLEPLPQTEMLSHRVRFFRGQLYRVSLLGLCIVLCPDGD